MLIDRLLRKARFYPTAIRLKLAISNAKAMMNGPFRWHMFEQLGIYGFGDSLLRVDFPPLRNPIGSMQRGPAHDSIVALFEAHRDLAEAQLKSVLTAAPIWHELPAQEDKTRVGLPWKQNPYFSGIDAVSLLGLLRERRPARFVEIGSGMSTRLAHYARDAHFPMEIISIDPEPRLEVRDLCDKVIRSRAENIGVEALSSLIRPGDVLFIDGSHRVFPGSDTTEVLLNIVPFLPAGCLIHIHDIYLPFDYPARFMERLWSEQYLLAAYLIADQGRTLRPVLPLAFFCAGNGTCSTIINAVGDASGSSIWLSKQ